ncbi:uncharacterized protein LOC144121840 [Amblyomma americanum]
MVSMPSNAPPATASNPASTVVVAQPRDPGTFCGVADVDVEDWLAMYERVSKHNRWDATLMLANVIFYLEGTARVWFETHEEELTSWATCKQKLRDLFGKPIGLKLGAKKDLASRVQSSTESYTSYIQDVLALCRKADSAMSETDKVGHILKGIADDAFNLLLSKDCTMLDSVLQVCRQFEHAKHRRIASRFDRLPNTAATTSCEDLPTLQQLSYPANLTRIVRRKLEAMAPVAFAPQPPGATIALIQAVVREEFAYVGLNSGLLSASPCTPTIAPLFAAASPTPAIPPRYRYRNPADWRTSDDRPICFTCLRVGHISLHCRSRWFSPPHPSYNYNHRDENGPRSDYDRRADYGPRQMSSRPEFSHANDTPTPRRYSRSPSSQVRRTHSPQLQRPSTPPLLGSHSEN